MKIPKGFRTYLFDQSEQKRVLESSFLKLFSTWGYREIISPKVEYYDTLAAGSSLNYADQVFKFTERESGKMLALRTDITPQIARTASIYMKKMAKPLRISYSGNVFRHVEHRSGKRQEITHAGIELIGNKSPAAEAEIIAIAIATLELAGLSEYKITLGHLDFFKGIIRGVDLDAPDTREVVKLIEKKDTSGLATFLDTKGVKEIHRERLLKLPSLFGGEEILDKALSLCDGSISTAAVEEIRDILKILSFYGIKDSILVDLGELRGLDYYTGMRFKGFVKGVGQEVFAGGRYDNLLGKFGESSPATGFAINVDSVLDVLEKQQIVQDQNNNLDFLVCDFTGTSEKSIALSTTLRGKGLKVALTTAFTDKKEVFLYAQGIGAKSIVITGIENMSEDELIEINIAGSKETKNDIEEFLCRHI